MSQLILDPIVQAEFVFGYFNTPIIDEPATVAIIGSGLPLIETSSNMVVEVGAETTEVGVWNFQNKVLSESVPLAGDDLSESIIQYMKKVHNLVIGERTAEEIKIQIGSAYPTNDDDDATLEVRGLHLLSGLPRTVTITGGEIRESLWEPLSVIVKAVKHTLNRTPSRLETEIGEQGISLTGSGSLLRGLDTLISKETGIKTYRISNLLSSVILSNNRLVKSNRQLEQAFKWRASSCLESYALLGIPPSIQRGANWTGYRKALEAFQQSQGIWQSVSARLDAKILANLGSVQPNVGNYAKALEAFQQSQGIWQSVSARLDAKILANLGSVQPNIGNYAKAIEALQQQNLAIKPNFYQQLLTTPATHAVYGLGQSPMISTVVRSKPEETRVRSVQVAQDEPHRSSIKVKRHTLVDFPSECILQQEVNLRVQVIQDNPGMIPAVQEGDVTSNTSTKQLTLEVYITALGFSVKPWHKPLTLPVSGNSKEIIFTLVPLEVGEQVIEIEIFRNPRRVAYTLVKTNVKDSAICLKSQDTF